MMGGWVYRNLTLLVMASLAITLSMATVASTAPPEKRTVCQDGVTKEVPIHAKAKGATEGPCEDTQPPEESYAEQTCRDVYQGTFISPDSCEWYSTNSTALLDDGRVRLTFNGHYLSSWDENNIMSSTLLSYEPVSCIDLSAGD